MAVATPEICVTLLQLSPNNPQLKKKSSMTEHMSKYMKMGKF